MMEVNLLKNLDHPNIVTYKESFCSPTQLVIIMEYCEGKNIILIAFSWRPSISHKAKVDKTGVFFRIRSVQLVRANLSRFGVCSWAPCHSSRH